MSELRKRIKTPAPDGWQQVADAVREVRDQIRESFGPRLEVRLADSEVFNSEALRDTLEQIRPLVVEATNEEMADPGEVRRLSHQALKRRIRDDVLTVCGFEDGGEVTAAGSADNDLASERADAVMAFLDLAQHHSLPNKLLPRGDRVGDWLPPGTPVKIFGQHAAVVVDEPNRVLVNMAGYPHPVSFPRSAIAKEGEPWTPPKPTNS